MGQRRSTGLNQSSNLSSIFAQVLTERINRGALESGQKRPPEAHVMAEQRICYAPQVNGADAQVRQYWPPLLPD
jgi:hypothetical protein